MNSHAQSSQGEGDLLFWGTPTVVPLVQALDKQQQDLHGLRDLRFGAAERRQLNVVRLVPLPSLGQLLACEQERGVSVWEAGGSMRLVGRLPHGQFDALGRQSADADKWEGAFSTVLDALHADGAGLLVTTAIDRFLCAWDERCLFYTSPSPRDGLLSRMPSSA